VIARVWRGWAAADAAEEIAAHLREGPLARYAELPGNVAAFVLQRALAGGVELVTVSLWETPDAVPVEAVERHPLLVARQTIADCFEVVGHPQAAARAA
jgi:hypothetical protein